MFDYLRNLTKSAEEKQQEALNAYLDDALAPRDRQQFERLLAEDAGLRLALEQRRAIKTQLRRMPRRRVPRNFTLDPAVYGRPQRQPLFQFYPMMRTAAVLTAFFFILAVAADVFVGQNAAKLDGATPDVAMVEMEGTRVVTETTTEIAVEEGLTVEVTRVMETGEETAAFEEPAAEEAMAVDEQARAAEASAEEAVLSAEPEMEAAGEAPPMADGASEGETDTAAVADDLDAGAANAFAAAAPPAPTLAPSPTEAAASTDATATKSTVPRPSAATIAPDRGGRGMPTPPPGDEMDSQVVPETAVPTPESPTPSPITGLRWLQISLGVLFIVLMTAVFYVRRQSFW